MENYGSYERYRKYVTDKPNPSKQQAIEDLTNGPYDKCVYHNNNSNTNIMEDYVISMKMYNQDNISLVSMIFSALHDDISWRTGTFIGTKATLYFNEKDQILKLTQHTSSTGILPETQIIDCDIIKNNNIQTSMQGHSCSDFYFMDNIMKNNYKILVYESMISYILAFDAEEAIIQATDWKPKKVSRIKKTINILVTTINPEKLLAVKHFRL